MDWPVWINGSVFLSGAARALFVASFSSTDSTRKQQALWHTSQRAPPALLPTQHCLPLGPAAGNQLYAAHCGDTRAVMSRNGEALRLTEDHKPNLPRERKRVEVRAWRQWGQLG